jgi:FkbM family methyltransferase
LNHLLTLLRGYMTAGHEVLFIDIGADVGTYAISIANHLRNLGNIKVLAFEPSRSSYDLLRRNVTENNLNGVVETRQLGLGDGSITAATLRFDPREPGGSGLNASPAPGEFSEKIEMSSLDAQVNIETLDCVVALKLDVEGSEISVLDGAIATLAAAQVVLLLVEDFVDARIVTYLENNGWSFQEKLTPYNSFWALPHTSGHDAGKLGDMPRVRER